jgi:formylglycine-generating enzyme required for sulfatase activity
MRSPCVLASPTETKGKTVPVGSYPPNAFGLHDMHGNVWELVEDCANDSYRGAPSDGSAWTTGNCAQRVLRGGSWDLLAMAQRSAFRALNFPSGVRHPYNGLRVARSD